jgi:hypothetical protein
MAYINRRASRRRSAMSAEFMYLLVVLAAGFVTAWWAGHKLGMDLSGVTTMVQVLGLNETLGSTRPVGYSLEANGPAPYCNEGEVASFQNGVATLHQLVGSAMGAPTECEHAASASGDTLQQTTTGLAAYDATTNTVTFTDGWHHYALTPSGYLTWVGTEATPPTANSPASVDQTNAQPPAAGSPASADQ